MLRGPIEAGAIAKAARSAAALVGLAWVLAGSRLAHADLAAAALAAEALWPLLPPSDGRSRFVALAGVGAIGSTICLVVANGGLASRLLALWLALSVARTLGSARPREAIAVAVGSVATAAADLLLHGWGAAPTLAGLAAVLVACVVLLRAHVGRVALLELQAETDPLTGVHNRLALDREINGFLESGQRRGALVFIDLDGFREVNRAQGHGPADRLLRAVGEALSREFADAFIGRAGGDEFVLLLGRHRDPLAVASHAVEVIAETGPPGLRLTATAGVAYIPEDGTCPDDVRAAADQALRWGKTDGKARALRYDRRRAALSPIVGAEEIRRLWSEERITIAVQPIVDLRIGRVRGYEALSRFAVDGDSSPLRWFALADRVGLRPQLEFACFQRALALLESRPSGTYLSVNLSPDVLEMPEVHTALAAVHDIGSLVLELTEDAVIDDYARLTELLAPHVARGLRIAVDDFGAGQANLRHAWSILPRYLKLDRTLVSRLDADDARRALVRSIVDYAERVGAMVVAEGVETTAELNALRGLGVAFAQGFRLAAPGEPWPTLEIDALLGTEGILASSTRDPELLVVSSHETAGELQKRFVQNPRAIAAVVEDERGRVIALMMRHRLLVALGMRFGFALYGDRPAIAVADQEFMATGPGSSREEMIARAMARGETRRYEPILFLDEDGRLLGKLTIQELLEPGFAAGPARELEDRRELPDLSPSPLLPRLALQAAPAKRSA